MQASAKRETTSPSKELISYQAESEMTENLKQLNNEESKIDDETPEMAGSRKIMPTQMSTIRHSEAKSRKNLFPDVLETLKQNPEELPEQ